MLTDFLSHRMTAINSDDSKWLFANDEGVQFIMDARLTGDVSVTKQPMTVPMVTGIVSYVPHQSAYPATFLSDVTYQDGSGAILAFQRSSAAAPWRLEAYAGLLKAAPLPVLVGKDGYALPPVNLPNGGLSPAAWMAWHKVLVCAKTLGCEVYSGNPCCAPAGYQDGAISDPNGDADMAAVGASMKDYRDNGFTASFTALPLNDVSFPAYRLQNAAVLRFAAVQTKTEYHARNGCFTIASIGQYVNSIMPAGKFIDVTVLVDEVWALAVPEHPGSGMIRGLAGYDVLAGDQVIRPDLGMAC